MTISFRVHMFRAPFDRALLVEAGRMWKKVNFEWMEEKCLWSSLFVVSGPDWAVQAVESVIAKGESNEMRNM